MTQKRGPSEAIERLERFASSAIAAWTKQAKTFAGANPGGQSTAVIDGAALWVSTAVAGGTAVLEAATIFMGLDDATPSLANDYKTQSSAGLRTLDVVEDFVGIDSPECRIPAANVVVEPKKLADGEVAFKVWCWIEGNTPGGYAGPVRVTCDGSVIETKSTTLNV